MKKLLCVLVLIQCLTLCGCYQTKDINSLGFLVALGIDKGKYTLQFANPIAFAGSDGEFGEDSLKTYTINANSLNSAINTAQEILLKKVDTSYLKLIVFSNDLKDGEIKRYTDAMLKSPRFHPDTFTAISKCTPDEFLKDVSKNIEMNPSKYYDNIFSGNYNQYSPCSTLKKSADEIMVMPIIDKGNNSNGIAVLKNGVIKYNMSNYSGEIYNILTGNLKAFNYQADEGLILKFNLPSEIAPEINGDSIYYNFILKCEIIENINNATNAAVAKKVKAKLEKNFINFLDFNYKENKTDILNFAKLYKRYFLTNKNFEEFIKNFNVQGIKFKININIDITRDGVMLNEN